MIILVDNKNFMIRLCKDSEEYHGFDVSFPGWRGWAKLLSDVGATVVLSGPVAEKFLDDEGIYYIHVEHVAKESFYKFERRMQRLIKENKEYLDTSMSFGKLMFAITEDGSKGTIHTDNLANIWRLTEDGRFYMDVMIDPTESKRLDKLVSIERAVAKELGCEETVEDLEELSDEVDEVVYSTDADAWETLFSADTYREALINVLAICELLAK